LKIAAVIFDCDGVLVDSEPASARAWREALIRFGYQLSNREFSRFIGTTDRELARALGARIARPASLLLATAEEEMRKALAGGLQAFPDALRLLERLDDLGVAVASNSDRWRLDCVLAAAGLGARFSVAVAADEVEAPKPAPDVYLEAARRLGIDPGSGLVIEDSPTGIAAALKAGMRVVAVDRGHFPRRALAGAEQVVESLDRLDQV
jgi:HAD superfamily hydrolase (TIGR01509 family)